MTAWEERMAEHAAERRTARQAEDYLRSVEERRAWEIEHAEHLRRFTGTCDVCGAELDVALDTHGIDYFITDDGQTGSWVRHYATAPPGANPDCARYFSRVYEHDESRPHPEG